MGCRKLQYYFSDGVSSDYHRGSGSIPNRFVFRFSSEYHDSETNLVYYNYRYYSPELGRWLNRDPIDEMGGANLYGMVFNDTVNLWDYLGLNDPLPPIYIIGPTITKFTGRTLNFKVIREGCLKEGEGKWYVVEVTTDESGTDVISSKREATREEYKDIMTEIYYRTAQKRQINAMDRKLAEDILGLLDK